MSISFFRQGKNILKHDTFSFKFFHNTAFIGAHSAAVIRFNILQSGTVEQSVNNIQSSFTGVITVFTLTSLSECRIGIDDGINGGFIFKNKIVSVTGKITEGDDIGGSLVTQKFQS